MKPCMAYMVYYRKCWDKKICRSSFLVWANVRELEELER